MKWATLPQAGGLYDQHPDLLDGFRIIFSERAEYEAEQREKEEAERKRPTPKTPSRTRASRPHR